MKPGVQTKGSEVSTTVVKLRAMRAVAEDRALNKSGATMAVFLQLQDATSASSWRAFIGQERLAQRTGFSTVTIKRAIKSLRRAGWLTIRRQHEMRQGRPTTVNVYYLRIPEKVAEWASRSNTGHGVSDDTLGREAHSGSPIHGIADDTSQGITGDTSHGVTDDTQSLVPFSYVPESRSDTHVSAAPSAPDHSSEEIDEMIMSIWSSYAVSIAQRDLDETIAWINKHEAKAKQRLRQLAFGVLHGSIEDVDAAAGYWGDWLWGQICNDPEHCEATG